MATPVYMPKQGQSVESCILTEWYKQEGEHVNKGDLLFAYETDKASFEYEAEAEGVLLAQFFSEMDEVPVLTNVAAIGEKGEDTAPFRPDAENAEAEGKTETTQAQQTEPAPAKTEKHETPEASAETVEAEQTDKTAHGDGDQAISPRAQKLAEQHKVLYHNLKGSGPYGRIIERDIQQAIQEGRQATTLAYEKQQTQQAAAPETGSGIGGRVTDKDLSASSAVYEEDSEVHSLSNMRKLIASSMHASLQNSAQLTHHTSADARNILQLRKHFKQQQAEGTGPNITLNDMISFAAIKALKQHPGANAHFGGDHIRVFHKVHLGFAVDTERGLMVPSVRHADDLSLEGLSRQMKALAEQAQKGNIDPDLLASEAASFTITNLGAYGVELFTPILNVPQVAILGVNTIINRPAELGDGTFGFVPYIGLSLTYDHRAIDGAPASLFLKRIKEEIEQFPLDAGR